MTTLMPSLNQPITPPPAEDNLYLILEAVFAALDADVADTSTPGALGHTDLGLTSTYLAGALPGDVDSEDNPVMPYLTLDFGPGASFRGGAVGTSQSDTMVERLIVWSYALSKRKLLRITNRVDRLLLALAPTLNADSAFFRIYRGPSWRGAPEQISSSPEQPGTFWGLQTLYDVTIAQATRR